MSNTIALLNNAVANNTLIKTQLPTSTTYIPAPTHSIFAGDSMCGFKVEQIIVHDNNISCIATDDFWHTTLTTEQWDEPGMYIKIIHNDKLTWNNECNWYEVHE